MTGTRQKRAMNATKRADELFSKQVRAEPYSCWAEGKDAIRCAGNAQCCHIVSRRYRASRWRNWNAVKMCAAHHVYYTHHPLEWQAVIGDDVWTQVSSWALLGQPERAVDALARLKLLEVDSERR